MDVRSLGYRTDIMLRVLEGSQVTGRDGYLVIRSPANPMFWWGNFLLLAAPPRPGETGLWLSRFAAEFPEAEHTALGLDVTGDAAADSVRASDLAAATAELLAAGFELDRSTVLAASAVHDPPHPDRSCTYRELSGDGDWRQAAELRAACYAAEPGGDLAFIGARIAAERGLTESGRGSWYGAFRDGRLLAQLGLIRGASGLARYQSVETHPRARRQGLAGTLVCHAARRCLDSGAATTLVMVADPDDVAIRVYRSLGFAAVETQTGFARPPAAQASR
jgi:ribosomal protein S18 acetylase RimI-like enzyme